MEKSLHNNVECYYGYNAGSFYGWLSEPQGVSAWWRETEETRVFHLSRSLLMNYLEP